MNGFWFVVLIVLSVMLYNTSDDLQRVRKSPEVRFHEACDKIGGELIASQPDLTSISLSCTTK